MEDPTGMVVSNGSGSSGGYGTGYNPGGGYVPNPFGEGGHSIKSFFADPRFEDMEGLFEGKSGGGGGTSTQSAQGISKKGTTTVPMTQAQFLVHYNRYLAYLANSGSADNVILQNRLNTLITPANGFKNILNSNDIVTNDLMVIQNHSVGLDEDNNLVLWGTTTAEIVLAATGPVKFSNGKVIGVEMLISPALINSTDIEFIGAIGHERIHVAHQKRFYNARDVGAYNQNFSEHAAYSWEASYYGSFANNPIATSSLQNVQNIIRTQYPNGNRKYNRFLNINP